MSSDKDKTGVLLEAGAFFQAIRQTPAWKNRGSSVSHVECVWPKWQYNRWIIRLLDDRSNLMLVQLELWPDGRVAMTLYQDGTVLRSRLAANPGLPADYEAVGMAAAWTTAHDWVGDIVDHLVLTTANKGADQDGV